jgi:6-pyruvoyltetrahydropterin/6-carboxytetrahydropterin synthase
MVVNLADLDRVFGARVMERFDHRSLNCDAAFQRQVPTTENFCRLVFGLMKDALPAGELEYVRVEETENNFFECYGD